MSVRKLRRAAISLSIWLAMAASRSVSSGPPPLMDPFSEALWEPLAGDVAGGPVVAQIAHPSEGVADGHGAELHDAEVTHLDC